MWCEAVTTVKIHICVIQIMTPRSLARSSYVDCHLTEILGGAVGTCEKAVQPKSKTNNDMQA
jgi:hypothetical protein